MIKVLEYSSLPRIVTPSIPDDPNDNPSLVQSNWIGRLPSRIWHETADLIPSLSNLFGNRNGIMVGGAEKKNTYFCYKVFYG